MEKQFSGKTPFFHPFFSTIDVDAFFLTPQGLFTLFHIFLHYGYLLLKKIYFFFFEKKNLYTKGLLVNLYTYSSLDTQFPSTSALLRKEAAL